MFAEIPPVLSNILIGIVAVLMVVGFWRSIGVVGGGAALLMRIVLCLLMLPFVAAAVIGIFHKTEEMPRTSGAPRTQTGEAAKPSASATEQVAEAKRQADAAARAAAEAKAKADAEAARRAAEASRAAEAARQKAEADARVAAAGKEAAAKLPPPVVAAPAPAAPSPQSPASGAASPSVKEVIEQLAKQTPEPRRSPEAAAVTPPAAPAPVEPSRTEPTRSPTATAPAPESAVPPPAPVAAAPPAVAPAAKPADERWDVVPVFYGTDRRSVMVGSRLDYGSERARRLELGGALVTVPKIHEVPNVERPWVYRLPFTQIILMQEKEDPARHFTLKEVKSLTREELAKLVRDRLAAARDFKEHAFVFVHGFNTTFEAALFRTAQIAYDLKFDGAPFLYSWPSKGQIGFQDYSYDRESSGQAEPYLKQFLEFVTKETGARSVSVIAHSMGNQVLLPVLRDLKRTAPEGVVIDQIILAAPDVDRDTFEFLAREISGVGKGITVLAASNDRALEASRRFWGGVPRAGDVPPEGPIVIPGIDTIDVTETSTEVLSLNHSGYAQKKQLIDDMRALLRSGERPPQKRTPLIEAVTTPRGAFWRYPPAR
jgi:esterase/lipase superfamily enzyme